MVFSASMKKLPSFLADETLAVSSWADWNYGRRVLLTEEQPNNGDAMPLTVKLDYYIVLSWCFTDDMYAK